MGAHAESDRKAVARNSDHAAFERSAASAISSRTFRAGSAREGWHRRPDATGRGRRFPDLWPRHDCGGAAEQRSCAAREMGPEAYALGRQANAAATLERTHCAAARTKAGATKDAHAE